MTDIYNICFYGGLVLAILLLITSVILFVVLKIPRVIGELSGRTARKGIEELKGGAKETSAVSKKEQAKYYNQNSGKIKIREAVSTETRKKNNDDTTADLRDNKKKVENDKPTDVLERKDADIGDEVTDLLRDDEEATDVLQDEEATAVLQNEEATAVLQNEEATAVLQDEEATDVLRGEDQTSVLVEKGRTDKLVSRVKVLYNVVVVNTDEKL
ncbi:MAG: hypothetical protein HDT40_09425 [Lachnospiraceae bacterium]|nr:hypothetical protein [Lachnospiraceae bacterium]